MMLTLKLKMSMAKIVLLPMIGAEVVQRLLAELNLEELSIQLKN
jgi:hypothetical protein